MTHLDQNVRFIEHRENRTFIILALIFGIAYIVFNPPFCVNDEISHLPRVFELSQGRLLTRSDTQGAYHLVPPDYPEVGSRFFRLPSWQKRHRRIHAHQVTRLLAAPHGEQKTLRVRARAGSYTPVPYLAEIPAIWIASALGLPVLWHLYLARVFSLLAFIALAALAISKAGALRWAYMALALLPMSLTQAAGVSADGLTNGLALLFFALLTSRSVVSDQHCTRRDGTLIGLLVVALSLCKPVFALLAIATLVLKWRGPRAAWKRWGYAAATWTASCAALLGWFYLNRDLSNPDKYSAPAQMHWLLLHPFSDVRVLGETIFQRGDDWLIQFVAVRDQLSSQLRLTGGVTVALAVPLLVLLSWGALRSTHAPLATRRWVTFWMAITWLGHFGAVALAMYLTFTPMANPVIVGIQGRYFLPMAPALVLLLSLWGRPVIGRWLTQYHGRVVGIAMVFLNLCVLIALTGRFYGPA